MSADGTRDVPESEVARLRRAVAELSVLNDLALAIGTSFEPDQIIQIIAERAARAVAAEEVSVYLTTPEKATAAKTVIRVIHRDEQTPRYHLKKDLEGWMHHNKRPLLCNAPGTEEPLVRMDLDPGIASLLCVPLLIRGELTGLLLALNKRGGGGFTADDQRLLAIIGGQSAQVLETARLAEEEIAVATLREEVKLTERIQQALLPQKPPEIPGYDIAGLSLPALQVGGDYYDFIRLDDYRYGICLGDVSGKGLPASLLMANLQATLRSQALQDRPCRDCLAWCNRLLFRSTSPEKFATLFYAVLDRRLNAITYGNAGHEPPLHFHADQPPRRLATGGLMVGVIEDFAYEDDVCPLAPGDLVVIYSDGVTDMNDAAEEPFGEERLTELIAQHRDLSAAALIETVAAAVRAHAGDVLPLDDLTLVAVKRVS
jgi:sigma-B regulation protein RsbU (phosphoserine phosphatase)